MKTTFIICLLFTGITLRAQDTIKQPFAGMNLSWINGQNRQIHFPLTFKDSGGETIVTGVAYLDGYYNYNFSNPLDNTQTISSTIGRHNEFTLNLASIGIETNYHNIIGRLWLQYGQMSAIIQDLDASTARGRNTGINNLKNIREAAAGYHFNAWHGINVEMGIFMSYIGLESYVTQENWSYQRSMVCDFTPFYFSGARIQAYPSEHFKTELWLLNGWQSYNSYSNSPGVGNSNYYRPNENLQLVANFYLGRDTQNPDSNGNQSDRLRFHHDNSIVYRYYNNIANKGLSQAAFSINSHYGFQSNDAADDQVKASQNFMLGTSVASRLWFMENKIGITLRGDYLTNQSVVNGINTSPYLTFNPAAAGSVPNGFDTAIADGKKLRLGQLTATLDIMPNEFVTFRLEYGYRLSSIPYFTGRGGTTSPSGWVNGPVGDNPWAAALLTEEQRITAAVNFRL